MQTEEFGRQIDRLRGEFLGRNDPDILFCRIFPARLVNGTAIGVVVGQEPHLGCLFALVYGCDIIEHGLTIEAIAAEREKHVADRRLEDFPTGRIVDGRNLVSLDNRFGGKSLSRPPCGDHVHVVLHSELADCGHCLRYLVRGIDQNHVDFVSGYAALYLVDIAEIILMPFGMELPPCGCRTGQIDGGSDFDIGGNRCSGQYHENDQDG